MVKVCNLAGCNAEGSSRCSRCTLTHYCSKQHQFADWKIHKKTCKQLDDEKVNLLSNTLKDISISDSGGKEKPIAYQIVPIEGRGLGVIATRNIRRGELIVLERPVITCMNEHSAPPRTVLTVDDKLFAERVPIKQVDPDFAHPDTLISSNAGHLVMGQMKKVRALYNALTTQDQEKVLQLHDRFEKLVGKKTPFGVYSSNSFDCGGEGSVLCPIICRFNSSCTPNVMHIWSQPYERCVAMRDIAQGEEMCNSYCNHVFLPRLERRRILKARYDFDCYCETCSLCDTESAASDARRLKLAELDDKIFCGSLRPQTRLGLVDLHINLLKEEGLDDPINLARISYDAFQLACMIGDVNLAKKWMKEAHAGYSIRDGAASENALQMKSYLRNPRSFPGWGS